VLGVRIPVGAQRRLKPLDMPVERFLALIRFENRDTLEEVLKLTVGEYEPEFR